MINKSDLKELKNVYIGVSNTLLKNILAKNIDNIENLYDQSLDHLEIKMFELGIDSQDKDVLRNTMRFVLNKYISILHRYVNGEKLDEIIRDVLETTVEELKDYMECFRPYDTND